MAKSTENQSKHEVGQAIVEHHQSEVIGVLHGRDRLRLQGTYAVFGTTRRQRSST